MESAVPRNSGVSFAKALPWSALVIVWIVWGSTYIGIRVGVETIPPFLMAGARYLVAGLLMCAVLLLWNRSLLARVTRRQWGSLALMAFLLLVCGNGSLCFAETRLASGVAALIFATLPIWVLSIDSILERRAPSALASLGLALGTLGIVALVGLHFGAIPLLPAGIVLFGSLTWAAGSVYIRRKNEGQNNPLLPALEMVIAGVMLLIVGAASGEAAHFHLSAVTRESLLGWLWLVGPGSLVGYTAYAFAVRSLPPHVTATYAYVNPVVAVILGTLLLGEPFTINVMVGGAAVVVSVVAILLSRKSRTA